MLPSSTILTMYVFVTFSWSSVTLLWFSGTFLHTTRRYFREWYQDCVRHFFQKRTSEWQAFQKFHSVTCKHIAFQNSMHFSFQNSLQAFKKCLWFLTKQFLFPEIEVCLSYTDTSNESENIAEDFRFFKHLYS